MSLNSLAGNAVARQQKGDVLGQSSDGVSNEKDVQNALSALVEYIPAEIIVLYLATLSALPVIKEAIWDKIDALGLYLGFALLTPVLFFLIYVGKRRAAGFSWKTEWKKYPWWLTVAATLAFLAWALAVPESPFLDSESGRALSGLVALIASVFLGVLGRVFGPKPS
jgi:hypothetical protein